MRHAHPDETMPTLLEAFVRHVSLTCKKHPNLRWSCKSIAYSPGYGYNGSRNIFFIGAVNKEHPDAPGIECQCPSNDLIVAPEDPLHGFTVEEQKILNDD